MAGTIKIDSVLDVTPCSLVDCNIHTQGRLCYAGEWANGRPMWMESQGSLLPSYYLQVRPSLGPQDLILHFSYWFAYRTSLCPYIWHILFFMCGLGLFFYPEDGGCRFLQNIYQTMWGHMPDSFYSFLLQSSSSFCFFLFPSFFSF